MRKQRLQAALAVASAVQRRLHRFGRLGRGSLVRPPYTITAHDRIFIGDRTFIGPNALLSVVKEHRGERYAPTLRIGDDTSIGQNFVVSCVADVWVGSKVLISSNVFIGDSMHRYDDPWRAVIEQPLLRRGPAHIGDGAFIGIGAIIMPGVSVGRHAVVGAGAVVTDDVPDFCVAAGNPARIIKRYDFARGGWMDVDGRDAPLAPAGRPRLRLLAPVRGRVGDGTPPRQEAA
jgi:acetyltransferase-like isoleucine patch superfamily enzyme